MSISTAGQDTDTLRIIHPATGEVVDVAALDDLALGLLFSDHYEIERTARTNLRILRGEIDRRGRERGYTDGVRRVYGKWERTQRTVWEQVEGGIKA